MDAAQPWYEHKFICKVIFIGTAEPLHNSPRLCSPIVRHQTATVITENNVRKHFDKDTAYDSKFEWLALYKCPETILSKLQTRANVRWQKEKR